MNEKGEARIEKREKELRETGFSTRVLVFSLLNSLPLYLSLAAAPGALSPPPLGL
jgi:hypothetical protein